MSKKRSTEQAPPRTDEQISRSNETPLLVYQVSEQMSGRTLAATLREPLAGQGTSWNGVKNWIHNRQVEVNGNLCMDPTRRVQSSDLIKVWSRSRPKPIGIDDIRIVHIDPHLIVVEKPAGVTSVRHAEERNFSEKRRQLQPTLDELLPPLLAKIQNCRWPPGEEKSSHKKPGKHQKSSKNSLPIRNPQRLPNNLTVYAVHRLDRDTSGLMIFARTRTAQQALIRDFRVHRVIREYVAVCHGHPRSQTIESLLVRDRGDGLRGSLPDNATDTQRRSAKRAVTHLLNSKSISNGKYSLVRCRLETGRTHQIRIHLSEAGHRLCGEPTYVQDSQGRRLADDSGAPRQALHSDRLAFDHPVTKEALKFQMPWPIDMANWIRSF